MSALQALGIAGFRSYSPDLLQKIEFETPLTLIWGKNGSGKTTIIEVLKYITTGALPPSCDKGKNFVMEPKLLSQAELIADARLKFRAFNGRPVLARRKALLTQSNKGAKFESIEQTLKTKDEKGEMFEINHQCAEIEKQIPQLLGISKPILENIVFCHQDESLWPFSDSANLKAIFDEMFETKKYTRIIDAFWEQHKDYAKYAKENRKALEYLRRLYDEDNRSKRTAIRNMEKVTQDSVAIAQLRKQLEAMAQDLTGSKDEANRKFELVRKRATVEERIKVGSKATQAAAERVQTLQREFAQLFGVALEVSQSAEELAENMHLLSIKKEHMQRQLEESQNVTNYTQKQMEIIAEVKQAKEYLPELRKEDSEDLILAKLQVKCEGLEKRRSELAALKRQKDALTLPELLGLPLSEAAYADQKEALVVDSQRLQESKSQILGLYHSLYRRTEGKRTPQMSGNIEEELRELQLTLKLKREELAKYSSMPSVELTKERKFKLHYTGIELQESIYSYCCDNKKCFVCSKTVTEAELRNIKAKFEKTRKKTEERLKEIDQSAPAESQIGIDPKEMVVKLTREIEKAEALEETMKLKYEEYVTYRSQAEQLKLNEKLNAGLRRVGLDKDMRDVTFVEGGTLETFTDRMSQYENLKSRIDPRMQSLKLYEERSKRNKEIISQRQAALEQEKAIKAKIAAFEEETRYFDILQNVHKRLSAMLKARGKNSKGKLSSDSESSDPQHLERQLLAVNREIRSFELQSEFLKCMSKRRLLDDQVHELQGQLESIDRDLRVIDASLEQQGRRQAAYNQLHVEYVSKKREIDLRGDMAFQEYYRPCEKEYLLKKMEMDAKEAAARDVEKIARALENTVSRLHKEKMDEVNKSLAEIWSEVYHGGDITCIEIEAAFDEESKRKKGYSYSIVMVTGEKRMEMKGRCSMGQKVLASIVIRLALAEVFSSSARILALDEPTTNLDREHIVNLAQQLGKLIEINDRKYLQMIIITHDLELIKLLQKYTPSYYEISRNEDRFSVITKREITEIFEQH